MAPQLSGRWLFHESIFTVDTSEGGVDETVKHKVFRLPRRRRNCRIFPTRLLAESCILSSKNGHSYLQWLPPPSSPALKCHSRSTCLRLSFIGPVIRSLIGHHWQPRLTRKRSSRFLGTIIQVNLEICLAGNRFGHERKFSGKLKMLEAGAWNRAAMEPTDCYARLNVDCFRSSA